MADSRYTRLPTTPGEDGMYNRVQRDRDSWNNWQPGRTEEDLRFRYELTERVPWKSILLALCLLLAGTAFFTISHLIFTSHVEGESSQAFGFLLLGILVFLPGFYETRIAYYAWRGFKGYNFSSIPAY